MPPTTPADPSRPPADQWGERLPRRLGLLSAIAVVIGSTIGSGIYRTPAIIAQRVPEPLAMLGIWALAGLLVLCGALTYSELAAMFQCACPTGVPCLRCCFCGQQVELRIAAEDGD